MRTAVVEGKATQDMSSLNDKVQPDGNLRSPPVPNGTIRAGSQALLNLYSWRFSVRQVLLSCHELPFHASNDDILAVVERGIADISIKDDAINSAGNRGTE